MNVEVQKEVTFTVTLSAKEYNELVAMLKKYQRELGNLLPSGISQTEQDIINAFEYGREGVY